jgi:hypothetical protein
VVYVAVAGCVLGAGCSRQAAPPQERAAATDSISPASPPAATAATQVSPDTAIQEIRSRYADLRRRRSSFREIKRDLTGLSTEGGMLQAFMDGEALTILEATFYGETGRAHREFYYDASGRPFFVVEVETGYEAPFGATGGRQEYRYYFYDGRLIRLLAGDRQVSPDEAAYAARVKNVLDWSRRLGDVTRRPE